MLKLPAKCPGQTGTMILLEAMSKDKVHLAKFVLDALDGEIVDSRTEGAQTPLIVSVLLPDRRSRCKFVQLLLQRGASVNGRDATGRTALTYACENGDLDAVKMLVRHNADPEIVDSWGNTALMYAAVAGHYPVVEFLVKAFKRLGLQIHRQNKVGNSAVEVARFLGHTECISALTSSSRKSREAGEPRPAGLRCTDGNDTMEKRCEHVVDKLEALQTCGQADCLLVQPCTWQSKPGLQRRRLMSMDSIQEFEREGDGSSSPAPLTPKPPPQSRPTPPEDHLPPLGHCPEAQTSMFLSPRPNRNMSRPGAPSALGILLTPLPANKPDSEPGTNTLEFVERRLDNSYYQKRCSLPTSVLSPLPPERTLVPPRKFRTTRRREASPCRGEPLHITASPAAAAPTTAFSALGNKLLRRFTSPEFKKDGREMAADAVSPSPRQFPRSETFPQVTKHPQVGSKPSIDSISSVKCEFDFLYRGPSS